ncbi:hypothetical protein XJ32_10085 [Helicobacter bilis]|uniref:Uncharacterized protein n=1 Tax=Helicobacter bilis TaxID=37372 RepID=A0A1Q2LJ09_9HELI|nr:hypothetical protein [Helicobacter bilis]AQQ60383.1 hypothetical protein XJ32_10085 [Helicobacter bilis]
MQKIIVFLCLLSAFLFAKELDVNRIKQGDFTELKAYLTQLKSISKQRDLNFNEYRTLTRFALVDGIDGVYNGGSNREFESVYFSKLSPFLAKEFGDLFAEYGIPLGNDIEEMKPEYYLYNELAFWFNDSKQIFTKKAYESFLFFKHNAAFATKIDEEGQEIRNCAYGDAGGGECAFTFKKPIKAKGTLTLNADFSLPSNEVSACDNPAYFSTFKTQDSRLEFINGGHIVLDERKYYDKFAPLVPKWYRDGLGGSVSYEVEVEIAGVMPWVFSACAAGKDITITNIKVGKKLQDNPNDRKTYAKKIDKEFNMYRLTINSTDKYVNLREKPNGKILEQIPTAKSDAILLLNLNMSLWEIKGVSEWQRQLGFERAEFSGYKEVMGQEWIKVLYFPPSLSPKTQTITEAKIGYIHKSQLIVSDLP